MITGSVWFINSFLLIFIPFIPFSTLLDLFLKISFEMFLLNAIYCILSSYTFIWINFHDLIPLSLSPSMILWDSLEFVRELNLVEPKFTD